MIIEIPCQLKVIVLFFYIDLTAKLYYASIINILCIICSFLVNSVFFL